MPDGEHRFYGELAEWWPLISPPGDYAEEAHDAARWLRTAAIPVHEVLELGSGGGHNASHLKAWFTMTLVDLAPQMLEVSRRLNPECEHVVGDMRTIRLGRTFDALFVHDAVDYMTTEPDLAAAIGTAFVHCRAGGVALLVPDHTIETFTPDSDHGGTDGTDGRGVRFLEWTWDPDPTDTWVVTEYAFIFRDPDGAVHVEHETHRTGLFGRATWTRLLTAAGFVPELLGDDPHGRDVFVAHRR